MPHIELLLLHELLYLHVVRFHIVIVFLAGVTTELFVAPTVQVDHDVRAEELFLIKDLV